MCVPCTGRHINLALDISWFVWCVISTSSCSSVLHLNQYHATSTNIILRSSRTNCSLGCRYKNLQGLFIPFSAKLCFNNIMRSRVRDFYLKRETCFALYGTSSVPGQELHNINVTIYYNNAYYFQMNNYFLIYINIHLRAFTNTILNPWISCLSILHVSTFRLLRNLFTYLKDVYKGSVAWNNRIKKSCNRLVNLNCLRHL